MKFNLSKILPKVKTLFSPKPKIETDRLILSNRTRTRTRTRGQTDFSKTPLLSESNWIDEFREIQLLSEWAYQNIPEVYSGFNRIAEIITKAIYTETEKPDILEFLESTNFKHQTNLLILQTLLYGHAITTINRNQFTIHDSIDYIFDTDVNSNIKILLMRKKIDQELGYTDIMSPSNEVFKLNPKNFHFFVLNPKYTTDRFGLPAAKPVLHLINLLHGIMKAEGKAAKNYVDPFLFCTAPDGATSAERAEVRDELEELEDRKVVVLPAGFQKEIIGYGRDQYSSQQITDSIIQRIITGLGIPKLALSIPEGTNKASAQYSLDLLHDKCIPLAEKLIIQLNHIFLHLFFTPDIFKLKKLSTFDIEMEGQAHMLTYQGLLSLATAATQEGLDPKVKNKFNEILMNYQEANI